MIKDSKNSVSSEVLAAFLDGKSTAQESKEILNALSKDEELREVLHISQLVDTDLELMQHDSECIPMNAMAATCNEENYCCLECEEYIMQRLGIEFNEQQLLSNAIKNGWLKKEGTALHNIGRHLESKGLIVTRQYKSTIEDIADTLKANNYVIAAVDGGELTGNSSIEFLEDISTGQTPDHTVVVLSINKDEQTITIYDPDSPNAEDTYPIDQFKDAWNDSQRYMVTSSSKKIEDDSN